MSGCSHCKWREIPWKATFAETLRQSQKALVAFVTPWRGDLGNPVILGRTSPPNMETCEEIGRVTWTMKSLEFGADILMGFYAVFVVYPVIVI